MVTKEREAENAAYVQDARRPLASTGSEGEWTARMRCPAGVRSRGATPKQLGQWGAGESTYDVQFIDNVRIT